MKTHRPAILFLLMNVASAACDGAGGGRETTPDTGDGDRWATVSVALTVVPAGVKCIRVTVTGDSSTFAFPFNVAAGGSSVLDLGRLPVGSFVFEGAAFHLDCAAVTRTLVPAWQSDPVEQVLSTGRAPVIDLLLYPNPSRQVAVDFRPAPEAIFVGPGISMALSIDGVLWGWGNNGDGQLGTGGTSSTGQLVPTQVPIGGVVQIAAGVGFTCARTTGDTASCWGANDRGQLGDGTTAPRTSPAAVTGLAGVKQISAGFGHACAVVETAGSGSALSCWGRNTNGELGDGTTVDRSLAAAVSLPSGFGPTLETCAGYDFTCARRYTGDVLCWGRNDDGQLGDGTTTSRSLPGASLSSAPFVGLPNAVAIACGPRHACALRPGGGVWCWGDNSAGQLGDGTNTDSATPVRSIAAGATALALSSSSTCARVGADVLCWGGNELGELGDGTGDSRPSPGPVTATDIRVLAGGGVHICAASSRELFCWGLNTFGQVGDGTREPRFAPTKVLW